MQREPPPFVWAVPDEKNILVCEFDLSNGYTRVPDNALLGNFLIVSH